MRVVRRLGLPAVLIIIAFAVGGCGLKSEPSGEAALFPSQAVDATGVAVSLPAAPDRIVSADPGASAVLRDIGLGDALVDVDVAGARAAAAAPATDLVVLPLAIANDTAAQIAAASAAPVFRYGAAPLGEAPSAITQLGLTVGRWAQAATVARAVADGIVALDERLASETPVRTLIEGPGATAAGPGTPIGQAVLAAGGANVFAADTLLDLAQLGTLDVQAWVSPEPGGTTLTGLRGIAELAGIPAIRDGRVVRIPASGYPIDAALPAALQSLADKLRAPALPS